MYNLFKDLVSVTHNVAKLGDIGDRVIGVQIGRVTDVDDPEYLRRIKVELEAYPGYSTDWLECYASVVGTDPPLPKLGQLTMVQFINGDPHRGIWQGVKVDPELNPSFNQSDPKYDSTHSVEGDTVILCGGNYQINCLETLQFNINNNSSLTLAPDGTCTLANDKTIVKLSKDGKLDLSTPTTSLKLDTLGLTVNAASINIGSAPILTTLNGQPYNAININGTVLTLVNGKLLINGVMVAMVGGIDSDFDTTIS